MKRLPPVLVAALAFSPGIASASDPGGAWLAAHTGWGFAAGELTADDPVSGTYAGMAAFGVEGGYQLGAHVVLAARVEYGILPVREAICPVMRCSAYDLSMGAGVAYRFTDVGTVVPWTAFGLGYEIAHITLEKDGQTAGHTQRGWQFFGLSGGADFLLDPATGIGPFASLAIASFSVATVTNPGGSVTRGIEHPGTHTWPVLGVRVFHVLE